MWRWTLARKLHNTRAETVSPVQGSAPVISDIVGDPGKCTNAWRALSVKMTSMIAQLPVTVERAASEVCKKVGRNEMT